MAGYIGTQAVSVNTTSATISDDLAVGDDLTVTDDATIGGTLGVTGITDFGSYQGSSVNSPVNIKSDSNHFTLSLEENSGTETWQLGIDADGDLNFHNSGGSTPSVTFADSGFVGIQTTAPAAPLQVDTDNAFPALVLSRDGGVSGRRPFGVAIGGTNDASMFINASNDTTGAGAFGSSRVVLMELESAGDVNVKTGNLVIGTAGKGIDFSAQASANSVTGVSTTAELLNHYERGTWTPGFEDNAGNAYDLSGFSNFKGQYVRIGDFVFLSFFVNDTGTLSGNTTFLKVTGFPFNIVNTLGNLTAGSVYTFGGFTGLGADDTLIFRTQVNSATGFVQVVSGGTGRNVTQADFGGAMSTAFTFSYRCI